MTFYIKLTQPLPDTPAACFFKSGPITLYPVNTTLITDWINVHFKRQVITAHHHIIVSNAEIVHVYKAIVSYSAEAPFSVYSMTLCCYNIIIRQAGKHNACVCKSLRQSD